MYLVPLSIVYDGLPEVWSLTAEQRGSDKESRDAHLADEVSALGRAWFRQCCMSVSGNLFRSDGGFGERERPSMVRVCVSRRLLLRSAIGSTAYPGHADGAGHAGAARSRRPSADLVEFAPWSSR